MSLNFGNQSAFGAPQGATRPAFGGNFSFGGNTSAFGAPIPATGAAPAFGAPTQAVAPTAFGAPNTAQQQPPAFGGFGQTSTATAAPAYSFGNQQQQQQTTTTGFGGFGQGGTTATSTAAAPAFGGFGQPQAAASSGFGGFGTSTTTTQSTSAFGGFGAQQPAQSGLSFGGFNNATATSAAPSFGGFGTQGATTGGFGTQGATAGGFGTQGTTGFSGFGGFGQKPATTTGFGGFGLGQQQQMQPFQQQQQQPPPLSADDAFAQAIFKVNIFGDERDTTVARWNYIQAMWGTGKAFYSQSAAPIEITPTNYLNRFKAMGYSKLQGKDNKMGLVALVFNKPQNQVKEQQQQIVNGLNQALGNKPTLIVHVEGCYALTDAKSQLVVYVEEKNPQTNESKKIASTELNSFLGQPMTKTNLTNMGVEQTLSLILPDEDKLKEYLEVAPKGIHPRMWNEAIKDNPDPAKFIPVPMIGFQNLKWRIKCQENEIKSHVSYLSKLEEDINELKQRHANTTAKIMEYRKKLADLSHRVLAVVVRQEITRKMGVSLSPEEEMLRSKLENMQALVSAPTQFKGRLSELLSQMRMQRNQWSGSGGGNEYALDRDSSEEMMTFLSMQQRAMQLLIETVNSDMKALKVISDGMAQIVRGKE